MLRQDVALSGDLLNEARFLQQLLTLDLVLFFISSRFCPFFSHLLIHYALDHVNLRLGGDLELSAFLSLFPSPGHVKLYLALFFRSLEKKIFLCLSIFFHRGFTINAIFRRCVFLSLLSFIVDRMSDNFQSRSRRTAIVGRRRKLSVAAAGIFLMGAVRPIRCFPFLNSR